MSDENQNQNNAPSEGNAPAAPSGGYSDEDVAKIIAADRESRGAPASESDPIARFRKSTSATSLYAAKPTAKPAAASGSSELGEIAALMKMQLMHSMAQTAPKPPAPPKPMTFTEKLASGGADVFVGRGKANSWSESDREQLVEHHAAELAKSGFRGNVMDEAERQARGQIAHAANRALRNVKLVPGQDHLFPRGLK